MDPGRDGAGVALRPTGPHAAGRHGAAGATLDALVLVTVEYFPTAAAALGATETAVPLGGAGAGTERSLVAGLGEAAVGWVAEVGATATLGISAELDVAAAL